MRLAGCQQRPASAFVHEVHRPPLSALLPCCPSVAQLRCSRAARPVTWPNRSIPEPDNSSTTSDEVAIHRAQRSTSPSARRNASSNNNNSSTSTSNSSSQLSQPARPLGSTSSGSLLGPPPRPLSRITHRFVAPHLLVLLDYRAKGRLIYCVAPREGSGSASEEVKELQLALAQEAMAKQDLVRKQLGRFPARIPFRGPVQLRGPTPLPVMHVDHTTTDESPDVAAAAAAAAAHEASMLGPVRVETVVLGADRSEDAMRDQPDLVLGRMRHLRELPKRRQHQKREMSFAQFGTAFVAVPPRDRRRRQLPSFMQWRRKAVGDAQKPVVESLKVWMLKAAVEQYMVPMGPLRLTPDITLFVNRELPFFDLARDLLTKRELLTDTTPAEFMFIPLGPEPGNFTFVVRIHPENDRVWTEGELTDFQKVCLLERCHQPDISEPLTLAEQQASSAAAANDPGGSGSSSSRSSGRSSSSSSNSKGSSGMSSGTNDAGSGSSSSKSGSSSGGSSSSSSSSAAPQETASTVATRDKFVFSDHVKKLNATSKKRDSGTGHGSLFGPKSNSSSSSSSSAGNGRSSSSKRALSSMDEAEDTSRSNTKSQGSSDSLDSQDDSADEVPRSSSASSDGSSSNNKNKISLSSDAIEELETLLLSNIKGIMAAEFGRMDGPGGPGVGAKRSVKRRASTRHSGPAFRVSGRRSCIRLADVTHRPSTSSTADAGSDETAVSTTQGHDSGDDVIVSNGGSSVDRDEDSEVNSDGDEDDDGVTVIRRNGSSESDDLSEAEQREMFRKAALELLEGDGSEADEETVESVVEALMAASDIGLPAIPLKVVAVPSSSSGHDMDSFMKAMASALPFSMEEEPSNTALRKVIRRSKSSSRRRRLTVPAAVLALNKAQATARERRASTTSKRPRGSLWAPRTAGGSSSSSSSSRPSRVRNSRSSSGNVSSSSSNSDVGSSASSSSAANPPPAARPAGAAGSSSGKAVAAAAMLGGQAFVPSGKAQAAAAAAAIATAEAQLADWTRNPSPSSSSAGGSGNSDLYPGFVDPELSQLFLNSDVGSNAAAATAEQDEEMLRGLLQFLCPPPVDGRAPRSRQRMNGVTKLQGDMIVVLRDRACLSRMAGMWHDRELPLLHPALVGAAGSGEGRAL